MATNGAEKQRRIGGFCSLLEADVSSVRALIAAGADLNVCVADCQQGGALGACGHRQQVQHSRQTRLLRVLRVRSGSAPAFFA
jgi:hypothetical protein